MQRPEKHTLRIVNPFTVENSWGASWWNHSSQSNKGSIFKTSGRENSEGKRSEWRICTTVFREKAAYSEYKKIKKRCGIIRLRSKMWNPSMLHSRPGIRRKTWKRSDSSRDKLTGNHQNENWWLPAFFAITAKQECISTHKVRAQLGIEDDILRGLGMCLQQAKCAECTQGHCLLTCEATIIIKI